MGSAGMVCFSSLDLRPQTRQVWGSVQKQIKGPQGAPPRLELPTCLGSKKGAQKKEGRKKVLFCWPWRFSSQRRVTGELY